MIVNQGRLALLDAQRSYLAGLSFVLITGNVTPGPTDDWGWLGSNEAAWGGYARQTAGSWNTPFQPVANGPALSQPATLASFANSSGGSVTFYGWGLADVSGAKLIGWVNIGAQTIPNGGVFLLQPGMTDNTL